MLRSQFNGLGQAVGSQDLQPGVVRDRVADQTRITPDQHHGPRVRGQGCGQGREVLSLAIATHNHHQTAFCAQAGQRGHGGAHVGALAVVKKFDAFNDRDRLHAVRLAAVFAQAVQHRSQRAISQRDQGQGRQCVGGVVAAADAQRVGWHQALNQNLLCFAPAGLFAGVYGAHQPGQTVHIFQPQVADPRGQVAAKAQHRAGGRWRFFGCAGSDFDFACRRGGHCHNRCVVAVEHHRSVVAENAGLGGGVVVHAAVPVQMVLAEVEHHGRSRLKLAAVVQLEAGEFQHPDLGQGLRVQGLR